jgi:RNA polymerase sigma-70 factor, ECF subfamily
VTAAAPVHLDPDWNHLRAQVRSMLGARLTSEADAEDVVQEVLLRVFRNASSLRDGDRFGSWLTTMVRNALADQLRSRLRHPVVGGTDEGGAEAVGAPAADEPDNAARNRIAAALRPFAERLPALYREVIILSELEGMPHAEIARRLAISISGVKSRVQRGRERLHRMLTDCCEISLDARHAVVECVPKQTPPDQQGCCGGPAPNGADACCARDADVKSAGGSGCGCASQATPGGNTTTACC